MICYSKYLHRLLIVLSITSNLKSMGARTGLSLVVQMPHRSPVSDGRVCLSSSSPPYCGCSSCSVQPGRQQMVTRVGGSLPLIWETQNACLPLAWPSPGCCEHSGVHWWMSDLCLSQRVTYLLTYLFERQNCTQREHLPSTVSLKWLQ